MTLIVIRKSNMEKLNSLATALKNKARSAAGAPGRAIFNKVIKPHYDLKMEKSNKEYGFLKDYNAREKSGVENSPKDRAIFESFKNRK